jgi:hypothetical protein
VCSRAGHRVGYVSGYPSNALSLLTLRRARVANRCMVSSKLRRPSFLARRVPRPLCTVRLGNRGAGLSTTASVAFWTQLCLRASYPGTQCARLIATHMDGVPLYGRTTRLSDAENRLVLGGVVVLIVGASRRSVAGALWAAASAPLLHRGITGYWPPLVNGDTQPDNTKGALGGAAACTCGNRFGLKCRCTKSTASGVASRTCRDS